MFGTFVLIVQSAQRTDVRNERSDSPPRAARTAPSLDAAPNLVVALLLNLLGDFSLN